ncbi:4-(cytidine 5'-diphospho)-2-C-methyl-D-erythritol kinase [Pseudoxanthobacter sp.]|uniref:4-(cytidine 5'-diphospho)-2-C-methyl-D-erythritol kinase n=1 Tax=Pseudoxanthobacter sp. TaxID=1925742 RepID=UPI002FE0EC00
MTCSSPPRSAGTGALAEVAPAKINLALHVLGRRHDGYHALDTFVAFAAAAGDRLVAEPADALSLTIGGPFAGGLSAGADNLVLRAAVALRQAAGIGSGARLHLEKHLPVASGIGGGSADAAAALRLLARLWGIEATAADLAALGASLGSDVPMCTVGRTLRAGGTGHELTVLPDLPPVWAVLVNPGVALATPPVFAALGLRPGRLDGRRALGGAIDSEPAAFRFGSAAELAHWLAGQRNDLQPPALALAPAIGPVLAALAAQPGALMSRLSGSGATCFALFAGESEAAAAAGALAAAGRDWWVAATALA